jgi:hypothetical protein
MFDYLRWSQPRLSRRKFGAAERVDARRQYESGKTLAVLARENGTSPAVVRQAIIDAGGVMRKTGKKPRPCVHTEGFWNDEADCHMCGAVARA